MKTTEAPFGEAVKKLLDERGWTLRELSRRTQAETEWGALSTMHLLLVGELRPTRDAMRRVAQVLRVPPEYFAEYRLADLRRQLDPEVVGLDQALRLHRQLTNGR